MLARMTLISISLWLAACATPPQTDRPQAALYCDTYLIYEMCVKDVNRDGVADLMYFDDTREIFMISHDDKGYREAGLSDHRCQQPMGQQMQAVSSRLLRITESTGFLQRMHIQNRLMMAYASYLPAINQCMGQGDVAANSDDAKNADPFGEDSFGEEAFY